MHMNSDLFFSQFFDAKACAQQSHNGISQELKGRSRRGQHRVHWPGLVLLHARAFLWSEQATTGQRNKNLPARASAAFAAAAFGLRQRARNLRGIPTAVIYQNKQRMYNKPPVRTVPIWAKGSKSKQKLLVLQATICNAQCKDYRMGWPYGSRSASWLRDTLAEGTTGVNLLLKLFLCFA